MQMNSTLRVLAVGNSFSEDSVEYLYQIFKETGHDKDYDEIVIGNLVVGGCSLDMHEFCLKKQASLSIYKVF